MRKDELADYLKNNCFGVKNAISAYSLTLTLGMSENDLRKNVNRLRREAVPIASDQHGYYYAATAHEIYTTIRNLKKMISGLDRAICGLETAMYSYGEIDEGGDAM